MAHVNWPSSTTFPSGDNALHLVAAYGEDAGEWDGTAEGVDTAEWYVIDGVGDSVRASNATETPHPMFGREEAVVTVGTPSRTVTLNGWFAEGDTGQNMLRTAQKNGTEVAYLNIRDVNVGNGYAQRVKVGGGEERQNAEGGLQSVSFTLAPQGDAVDVTGFDAEVPS